MRSETNLKLHKYEAVFRPWRKRVDESQHEKIIIEYCEDNWIEIAHLAAEKLRTDTDILVTQCHIMRIYDFSLTEEQMKQQWEEDLKHFEVSFTKKYFKEGYGEITETEKLGLRVDRLK